MKYLKETALAFTALMSQASLATEIQWHLPSASVQGGGNEQARENCRYEGQGSWNNTVQLVEAGAELSVIFDL